MQKDEWTNGRPGYSGVVGLQLALDSLQLHFLVQSKAPLHADHSYRESNEELWTLFTVVGRRSQFSALGFRDLN